MVLQIWNQMRHKQNKKIFSFETEICTPGASFPKLTYVSDVIFGNFLLANAHNILI